MEHRIRISWPVLSALLAGVLLLCGAARAGAYKAEAGPYDVKAELLDLHDAERDRAVPLKVYAPEWGAAREAARPVVLVSHGLGGTREGLSYLGKYWASHGYICVHMQHRGSDDRVWRDVAPRDRLAAMRDAARDPVNALDRAADVTFVLDELERLNADNASRLHGRVDLTRAGIAGHSFGAWTAMAAGGMMIGGEQGVDLGDLRIRCVIPLSPPVSPIERWHDRNYGAIAVPALFMTGTLDTSPINNTTAEQRQTPYKKMPGVSANGAPKYLINFDGADHMTFSGDTARSRRLRKADPTTDPVFHGLILQSTTAFLDAYLLGDQDAKRWLNGGAFVKAVGEHGEVMMDAD